MVVGATLLGLIQDKFGHSSSICFILFLVLLFNVTLIIINEIQVFNGVAYFIMFGVGAIDNCI